MRGRRNKHAARDGPHSSEEEKSVSIYDISVNTLEGQSQSLHEFKGQVLLIVNVASRCGFTPQYTGLEALYGKYHARGLSVLGFPCNQFGHQEPGDADEIRQFCSTSYPVSFPLFAKVEVNGANADPLYVYLKSQQPGILGTEAIKWNFTKFLVDRNGVVVKRYAPKDTPESLDAAVAALLG
jgi:glutathione peroxidase